MTPTTLHRALVLASALALAIPLAAAAQDPAAAAPAAAVPTRMVVQPIENRFLAAPDVKFGRIDGSDSVLVGGYAGWVTDRTFLVGGGGYWLASGGDDVKMAYGGLVLEWLARTDHRIGFGARTLIGGGEATVPVSFAAVYGPLGPLAAGGDIRFGGHHPKGGRPGDGDGSLIPSRRALWTATFFIAEPQVNVLLNVTDWMRINAGVGYRLVGGASFIDDRLRGVSGTLAVQFGGGR